MNKEEFKAILKITIEAKILELLKKRNTNCLLYPDAMEITHMVRNIFITALGSVPNEIEVACLLSDAVLAPSKREKEELIKKAKALSTGVVGLIAIISAIATALGWGLGIKAAIIAWFAGTSMLGPIGLGMAGVTALVIAGYFMFSDDKEELLEKYKRALENGLNHAVDEIWEEHKEKLSTVKVTKNGSGC